MNPFNRLLRQLAVLFVAWLLMIVASLSFAQVQTQNIQTILDEVKGLFDSEQYSKAAKIGEAWLLSNPVTDDAGLKEAYILSFTAHSNQKIGKIEKSISLFSKSLVILEKVIGPEHPDSATSLNNLALSYRALAQYDKALPLQVRALTIWEKVRGLEHPATAVGHNNLGQIYSALKQYDRALLHHARALEIREKVLGPEHADTANTLNDIAHIYSALAQHDKALPLRIRVLTIWEKALGPQNPNTAMALNNLALTYRDLAQHDKALPLQTRALAIWEKVLGPEHLDTAMALNNLASTYSDLAQYEKALHLQIRALAIREKVLGTEHPDTADALANLASTYSDLAQYEKALHLQIRALAIREKVLGTEHRNTAVALHNLASTYSDLAQPDKALPLFLRSFAIKEKVVGPELSDTAFTINGLAHIYIALAQHDKALPLQIRALAIWEKVLGPEHPNTAMALNNVATTYIALEQHDKALPLQIRALAIWEKVLGPEHPNTASALNNLAYTYDARSQYDKALPLYTRALKIQEKVLGLEHPHTAQTLNNLALTFRNLAQHDKAQPLLIRSLVITENGLGPGHLETARALSNLSLAFEDQGNITASITLLKSAVNIYQSHRERVATIGASELNTFTQHIAFQYQSLARLLADQSRLAEAQQVLDMLKESEQFEFVRRRSDADHRHTRIAYTPDEAQWMDRYRQVARRLADLSAEARDLEQLPKSELTPVQQSRLVALKADMAVAEQAFTEFLMEMQRTFTAQGQPRAPVVADASLSAQRDLQALIQSLGADVALLQYYVTDDQVGMILTTPSVVVPFSARIDVKTLNRRIFKFRALLRDPRSDPKPAAQEIYQLLLAPVAKALEQAGAKTVMLSLDGNLRHIPFGALHDGKQYAAQRWNLPIYTAMTRDKLRDDVAPRWQAAGLGVTRAIGEFQALPAVKDEMDAVQRITAGPGNQNSVYLDEQFTAQRLRDVGQRDFQLMHISSHFSWSPGTEINSFLLLGDGQHLTLGDIRTQNYRFDQVDMLTLSACDTGLGGGRDANGREIEGLGVIAQQQGAKSVLATLWPVADGSTAQLMADMYARRQKQGLSKIKALRQAQLALMAQDRYAHPFYWAPFILLGNWK